MADDLENELQNLLLVHLTESEMIAYLEQKVDQMLRARIEIHKERCFICRRELENRQQEYAALSNRARTKEQIAFVDRAIEEAERKKKTAPTLPLKDRLSDYLEQIRAAWRTYFGQLEPVHRGGEAERVVWRWESDDGALKAWAALEKNSSITIHFSSDDPGLGGTRLKVGLGGFSQEITLEPLPASASEIYAKVMVPKEKRPRNLEEISIEVI